MVSGRRGTGFALLDAIVAGLVLGLALVGVIGLTGQALAQQRQGERLQEAAMLADERLNLVLAVGPEAYQSLFGVRGRCDAPFDEYSWEIDIDPVSEADPYAVRVEIGWRDAGRRRSIDIETLIARRQGDEPDPERRPDEIVERNT